VVVYGEIKGVIIVAKVLLIAIIAIIEWINNIMRDNNLYI